MYIGLQSISNNKYSFKLKFAKFRDMNLKVHLKLQQNNICYAFTTMPTTIKIYKKYKWFDGIPWDRENFAFLVKNFGKVWFLVFWFFGFFQTPTAKSPEKV